MNKSFYLLKYKRLKQKNITNILTTIAKRTPRYIRNRKLFYDVNNDDKFCKNLIPGKIRNQPVNKFGCNLFSPSKKNNIDNDFSRLFDTKKIISKADKIISNKMQIFNKPVNYISGFPSWNSSIDKSSTWPLKEYTRINYQDYRKYGDPRYAWELNRFLHLIDLGRASWLTLNNKYSKRICEEINNWIIENPFLYGINWVEGIEVGIRSINWVITFDLISKTSSIDNVLDSFVETLYLHGYYLEENLSDKWITNNNHIIAELAGLAFIGNFFKNYSFGQKWFNFALDNLILELENQVMDDGFIWESSTGYHKFVTEMIYLVERLASKENDPRSKVLKKILDPMLIALHYSIKPNGDICRIGDSDDAVVLKFSNNTNFPDFLNSASISYSDDNLFFGKEHSEYSFWINGYSVVPKETNKEQFKVFSDSGLIFYNNILNGEKFWCCFNAGNQHEKYLGAGHRHADILSLNVNLNGNDLIVDSGTYKYFDSKVIRDYFKGTIAHSTTNIRNKSQIKFKERFETSLKYNAISKITFIDKENYKVTAEHDGYVKDFSTILERNISFSEKVEIIDSSRSSNNNQTNVNLVIPFDVKTEIINDNCVILNDLFEIIIKTENVKTRIYDSFLSKSYGVLRKCKIVQFTSADKQIKTDLKIRNN